MSFDYGQLRYKSKAGAEGIRLADSPLLLNEATEPNLGSYTYDETKPDVAVSRDAYAIPENGQSRMRQVTICQNLTNRMCAPRRKGSFHLQGRFLQPQEVPSLRYRMP